MRGIKETQELKLGDAQGILSLYSKKSQASKLGDAPVGIPPFFFNNYRSVLLSLSFASSHDMCYPCNVILFCFACCLNNIPRSEILKC